MKNFRQLFTAAVLTLAISSVAFAGDMWTPGVINPPPPPVGGRATTSTPKVEVAEIDNLTLAALLLCKRMLTLL